MSNLASEYSSNIIKSWVRMSDSGTSSNTTETWSQYAKCYDPIQIGSIDGTDTEPHDKAIIRAGNSEYRSNRHVKGNPECTIFVARLSPKTTKDTIKEVFSKFGRLRRFRLVKDIVTGTPKGYAFIEYETERAAEDAYRKANKMYVDGQPIFVDFECERLLKGWKPRRLGGGFGGRKESGQLRFGGRDRPFHKPITLEIQERERRERDLREWEYRREEHGKHKDKELGNKEEKHRYSREKNEDRAHYGHSQERSESKQRKYKSLERSEAQDQNEHRQERHHKERIKRNYYLNRYNNDKNSGNSTANEVENRNGK